jgi:hypothetical protein
MVRPEGQTMTDQDAVMATLPTNNDDGGRPDQSFAEEFVARAAPTASIWSAGRFAG